MTSCMRWSVNPPPLPSFGQPRKSAFPQFRARAEGWAQHIRVDPDNKRMSDTRRLAPIGAVAAALVLGAGVLGAAHLARSKDAAPDTGPRPALAVLPPPGAGVL